MILETKPLGQPFYKSMYKVKHNHTLIHFELCHAPLFQNKSP